VGDLQVTNPQKEQERKQTAVAEFLHPLAGQRSTGTGEKWL